MLAVWACPVVGALPAAEDVDGDDGFAGGSGVVEGGVVGDAEIAAKPMDDAGHAGLKHPLAGEKLQKGA